MIPQKNAKNIEYEKVKTDEWITGTIANIEYDLARKSIWQGKEKTGPAVRIVFEIEGCKYPHKTPWMAFYYVEKSNLYKKYLSKLVDGITVNCTFDMDALKGLSVKMMWSNNGEYQNLDLIKPVKDKLPVTAKPEDVSFNPEEAE